MTVLVSVDEPGDLDECSRHSHSSRASARPSLRADGPADLSDLGVETLHVADAEVFSSYAPAAIARALDELVDRLAPSAVVGRGNERGNEILARLAAMTDLPFAANCIAAAPPVTPPS